MDSEVGVMVNDLGFIPSFESSDTVWSVGRMFANCLFLTGNENNIPLILNS